MGSLSAALVPGLAAGLVLGGKVRLRGHSKGPLHTYTFPVHIPFTLICMGSSSAALGCWARGRANFRPQGAT